MGVGGWGAGEKPIFLRLGPKYLQGGMLLTLGDGAPGHGYHLPGPSKGRVGLSRDCIPQAIDLSNSPAPRRPGPPASAAPGPPSVGTAASSLRRALPWVLWPAASGPNTFVSAQSVS